MPFSPSPLAPRSLRVVFVSDRSSEREKGTRGEGNQTAPSIRTAHTHTQHTHTHTHTHTDTGARLNSTPSSSLVALFILLVGDTFVRQLKTRRSHSFFLLKGVEVCGGRGGGVRLALKNRKARRAFRGFICIE